jgi:hypothetical protein
MKKKSNNYKIINIITKLFNKNNTSMKIMSLYIKNTFKKLIDDCFCLINKVNLKRFNVLNINRIKDVKNIFFKNINMKYPLNFNSRRFCFIE